METAPGDNERQVLLETWRMIDQLLNDTGGLLRRVDACHPEMRGELETAARVWDGLRELQAMVSSTVVEGRKP